MLTKKKVAFPNNNFTFAKQLFYLVFGCPSLNFAISLTNPMLITAFDTYLTQKKVGALQRVWIPKPSQASSVVGTKST